MRKALVVVALILAAHFSTQAQSIEYGSPDDLKGVKKIFVDTGADMEVRANILKEIGKSKKKLPDLEVVSRAEDAEVLLVFSGSSRSYVAGVNTEPIGNTGSSTSSAIYQTVTDGGGVVIKPLGENRVRLVMSFKDSRTSRFERRPSTNFARAFVRAYMKANDVKD